MSERFWRAGRVGAWALVALLLFGFPPRERRADSGSGARALTADENPAAGSLADEQPHPPSLEHDHSGEHSHDAPPAWASAGGGDARLESERQGLTRRLLGPIATVLASVWWVRYDLALRGGQFETAYARARTALTLDPGAGQGWITLARHMIVDRGALLLEPDYETRLGWIRASLELLEHAQGEARNRHEVAFARGVIFEHLAMHAEELGWPPGEEGALRAAAEAFDLAGDWGHTNGHREALALRERMAR